MTRSLDRPARMNRALLAMIGLLLLAAGGYAVAAYGGHLSWVDPDDSLMPDTSAPPRWVLVALVIGAIVIGLLCLRWIAAQLHRLPRPVTWDLTVPGAAGGTTLSSSVAADALAADLESYTEIRAVAANLSGPERAPELHLIVTAHPGTDITALRRRILGEGVARLRQALEVAVIPVSMEFRLNEHSHRTR
ncbi:hypothetical protein [Nocardia jejuensis]|uniref:hypothetical protein n=1 Tax=Nocardia jejuensis TaxID=328049 RepID=UPI00082A9566|nr:hypothetical protein [Nocardia jejuensis]